MNAAWRTSSTSGCADSARNAAASTPARRARSGHRREHPRLVELCAPAVAGRTRPAVLRTPAGASRQAGLDYLRVLAQPRIGPSSRPSTGDVEPRVEVGPRADGESIDIYDRNVLVIGGREGVAAARRFAARVEAACDKHAQLAAELQQEVHTLRARAEELQARVKKSEDTAKRAESALQMTAKAPLAGRDMPLDLATALARKPLTELRQGDPEVASRVLDWLLDIVVEKPAKVRQPVEQ